jgi:hypothetical protein
MEAKVVNAGSTVVQVVMALLGPIVPAPYRAVTPSLAIKLVPDYLQLEQVKMLDK